MFSKLYAIAGGIVAALVATMYILLRIEKSKVKEYSAKNDRLTADNSKITAINHANLQVGDAYKASDKITKTASDKLANNQPPKVLVDVEKSTNNTYDFGVWK